MFNAIGPAIANSVHAPNPDCADLAPSDPTLTRYDEEHLFRMLDANADGAVWREVSRIVLYIDAEREPDRARRAFDSEDGDHSAARLDPQLL